MISSSNSENITFLINKALKEDIQDGDHSSLACIPKEAKGECKLLAKQKGVISGINIAKKVFEIIDPQVIFKSFRQDGDIIDVGDIVFTVSSSRQNLLKGERLALNYMQRMSGIATKTRAFVDLISHTNCKLLDTRKTTPNNRVFEKMAVKIGGGFNHRFGLYDMIMLKDNHIDFAGGIPEAINKTHEYLAKLNKHLPIEIEVRDFDELNQVIKVGKVDRIMLDNFSVSDTKKALEIIHKRFETESSGGINFDTIADYAETGVDYISVGALTHQINSLDLSLKAI